VHWRTRADDRFGSGALIRRCRPDVRFARKRTRRARPNLPTPTATLASFDCSRVMAAHPSAPCLLGVSQVQRVERADWQQPHLCIEIMFHYTAHAVAAAHCLFVRTAAPAELRSENDRVCRGYSTPTWPRPGQSAVEGPSELRRTQKSALKFFFLYYSDRPGLASTGLSLGKAVSCGQTLYGQAENPREICGRSSDLDESCGEGDFEKARVMGMAPSDAVSSCVFTSPSRSLQEFVVASLCIRQECLLG
jgi:hypothetical protein